MHTNNIYMCKPIYFTLQFIHIATVSITIDNNDTLPKMIPYLAHRRRKDIFPRNILVPFLPPHKTSSPMY